MTTRSANPRPPRRWFQFSLRSLGLVTALCCAGLAFERNTVRSRIWSISEIKKQGGVITFDESRNFRPAWIQSLGGEVVPPEVVGVDLKAREVSDETLEHLA